MASLISASSALGDAASLVVRPLRAVTGIVPALEVLARDLRGLRGDMREVIEGIEALRADVRALSAGIDTIAGATVSLDERVTSVPATLNSMDERLTTLHHDLGGVSALAQRVDRLPRLRRARAELET